MKAKKNKTSLAHLIKIDVVFVAAHLKQLL